MIGDGRPADALSVLELAVLFTLYPVHHDAAALSAWHRALASNDTAFATWVLLLPPAWVPPPAGHLSGTPCCCLGVEPRCWGAAPHAERRGASPA